MQNGYFSQNTLADRTVPKCSQLTFLGHNIFSAVLESNFVVCLKIIFKISRNVVRTVCLVICILFRFLDSLVTTQKRTCNCIFIRNFYYEKLHCDDIESA